MNEGLRGAISCSDIDVPDGEGLGADVATDPQEVEPRGLDDPSSNEIALELMRYRAWLANGESGRVIAAFRVSRRRFKAVSDQRTYAEALYHYGAALAHEDREKARRILVRARGMYRDAGDDLAAMRVASALGMLLLASGDDRLREEGAGTVRDALLGKLKLGSIDGAAADLALLSEHAFRCGHLERALGCARSALRMAMTRDGAYVPQAYDNLIAIYLDCGLYAKANGRLKELDRWVEAYGGKLDRRSRNFTADTVHKALKASGRHTANPPCICSNNRLRVPGGVGNDRKLTFDECCGRADREPLSLDLGWLAIPGAGPFERKTADAEGNTSLDDYIDGFAGTSLAEGPDGFAKGFTHDGWIEASSIVHMARYHLMAARDACGRAKANERDVGSPIAAVILSVCSLEAYLNGLLAYRPDEIGVEAGSIPDENPRATDGAPTLIRRWDAIGLELCAAGWLAKDLRRSVCELIRLRNSLVHAKPRWEELPGSQPAKAIGIKDAGYDIGQREGHPLWPDRVMTASLAVWAVTIAERFIEAFRSGYCSRRDIRRAAA